VNAVEEIGLVGGWQTGHALEYRAEMVGDLGNYPVIHRQKLRSRNSSLEISANFIGRAHAMRPYRFKLSLDGFRDVGLLGGEFAFKQSAILVAP